MPSTRAARAPGRGWSWGACGSDADELKKASELNPRWAEPYYQLADLDPAIDKEHLEQRAALLKKAANLDPRSIDYWTALAKTDIAAKDFGEAEKAWSGAERAAATDEDRERIRKIRLDVQAKQFDEDAAERKRIKDEQEADLAAREGPERCCHSRLRGCRPQENESEWRRAAQTAGLV